MNEVVVSPKFQIVIPRHLREAMDIQPGARLQVIPQAGHFLMEDAPEAVSQQLENFIHSL